MRNDLEIKINHKEKISIVELFGNLNARNANQFKNSITNLADDKSIFLVIDMEGVDFVDSTGLGSLVAALRIVREKNGDIKVCNLKDNVRSVFELIRLNKLFDIFDSRNEAIDSY